ncbi:MAG: GNAT family N-acetyltransferase [Ardenticatenaceae bacterium]|nr:GNAT family N-acetyltransferase [Ardenticatenaceae bacterium]MCB9446073.1 GNAT family N-acetyltransferase [Ardenticatenaceae bacterium]
MQTTLISGTAVFTELASEWDALARQGMTDTPFQTLAYQQAWWTHLQPVDTTLQTIAVRQSTGELAAIACLYVTADGIVHFNGCVEETDYLDLICAPANAEASWTAVFDLLCSPQFPDWNLLELCNIPAASPSREILAQLAQKHDLTATEVISEVCPVIQLPATFDAYLDELDSKQRRELNRKLRRADAADVNIHIVNPDDDLTGEVDAFLELLQKSTFEKRDWLTNGRRAVFHDAAQAALANGTLQLMFAEVDGQKAATLFNFDYKSRTWVYNSGLDPSAFGALSLGVVLTAKAIEHAIANGRSHFDFLRGNETYKYRFRAKDTEIYKVTIAPEAS